MRRINLPALGIAVDPMTASEAAEFIRQAAMKHETTWIANYNLHALYLLHSNEVFRGHYSRADIFLIDGWPLVAASRMLGKRQIEMAHRIGSSDWLDILLKSEEPIAITAIGGTPNSSKMAAIKVSQLFPTVRWHAFDGFMLECQGHESDNVPLESAVQASDLVIVGMGMPNQERWIHDHIGSGLLSGKVIANVGGCIDYVSGVQKLAPRWMGAAGIEWLYRLVMSPRRLFYRYVVEPFLLLKHLLHFNVRKLRSQ